MNPQIFLDALMKQFPWMAESKSSSELSIDVSNTLNAKESLLSSETARKGYRDQKAGQRNSASNRSTPVNSIFLQREKNIAASGRTNKEEKKAGSLLSNALAGFKFGNADE